MSRFIAMLLVLVLPFSFAAAVNCGAVQDISHVSGRLFDVPAASAQVSDSPVAPNLFPVAEVREVENPDNHDARLFLHNRADPNVLVSFDLSVGLDGNTTAVSSGTLDHFTAGIADDPNLSGDPGSYFITFHADHCPMCATLIQSVQLKAGIDTVVEYSLVTFD